MSLIGQRFTFNGKPLTIVGTYGDGGPDDPPGWYYKYDGEALVTHWISASAVPIRFKPLVSHYDEKEH